MDTGFTPWIEKYRPRKLSEVLGNESVVRQLEGFVKSKNPPHMLFSGPPGSGKTSSAIVIANELYGDNFKESFLELNGSDERGIDVVRNKIKDFARTMPLSGVPFKTIFLDESDAMTQDAQQALRRTMEKYSTNTRFILSCVSTDTTILLPEEKEITIKEFMEKFGKGMATKVENVSEEGIPKEETVLACTELAPEAVGKRILEITTMSGRKLRLTNDHKVLTGNGWKEAQALNVSDKIAVFPHLETTPAEFNENRIFSPDDFENFICEKELHGNHKVLAKAAKFEELTSRDKDKILKRLGEIRDIVQNGKGLTKREKEIYDIIASHGKTRRADIGGFAGLKRNRTCELLRSMERKGIMKRSVNPRNAKEHSFSLVSGEVPSLVRNKMDARKLLEKEFSIKISYGAIQKHWKLSTLNRGLKDSAMAILEEKQMGNLTYSNPKIGAFTRIFGFIFGDGHITKDYKTIVFTGKDEALEEVMSDLKALGFDGMKITKKTISHSINGRLVVGITTSFRLNSDVFVRFLEFLGAPVGDKIITTYSVPSWIMNGTKFVKREFLRSLYGCEGYSPKIYEKNFEALCLKMHKARHLQENMLQFYGQLKILLQEFGVSAYIGIHKLDYQRKDGNITDEYVLTLNSSNENAFRFFSRVGYAYEKEKIRMARRSSEYLRHKLHVLELQKVKAKRILELATTGKTKTKMAEEADCTTDFVSNQLKGKEVHLPRSFPNFKNWLKKYGFKQDLVLNEIESIKESEKTQVMDITCLNDHNFITNGIVSHNCNYSSRIIEPVQSRCAVFRFARLEEKDLQKILDRIVKEEGLKVDDKAAKALLYVSEGDARKLINAMQGAASISDKVSEEEVYRVASRARPEEVSKMVQAAMDGKFTESRDLLDSMMLKYGMSGEEVILQVFREVTRMNIPDKDKVQLVDRIGEYDFRIVEGADERIQLEALLAQIMLLHKK